MNEIVNCAAYLEGRRIANVEINNIHEVLEHPEQFLWVGLHEPGEETLVKFQKEFDLTTLPLKMHTLLTSGQNWKDMVTQYLLCCAQLKKIQR